MDFVHNLIDIFLHLDQHLANITETYGTWIYVILITIIFCETGLIITPFLPGDSLLFAAGALAAIGQLDLGILWISLIIAGIVGDTVNYHLGKYIGLTVFKPDARFFKTAYLDKTHAFYERYGGKTIIIARFIPLVRTFAPFVAGASVMRYRDFVFYNVTGAILWVSSMLLCGYIFGNIPWIKQNFSFVVLGIIAISCLPMCVEIIKHYQRQRSS